MNKAPHNIGVDIFQAIASAQPPDDSPQKRTITYINQLRERHPTLTEDSIIQIAIRGSQFVGSVLLGANGGTYQSLVSNACDRFRSIRSESSGGSLGGSVAELINYPEGR